MMQHRTQVGLLFYSVTVIQGDKREWFALAEVAGESVSRSGTTKEEALSRWQAAAVSRKVTADADTIAAHSP